MTYIRIFIFAAILASAGLNALAQQTTALPNDELYGGFVEEVYMDMDLEPNIATPPVPEAEKPSVVKYVRSVAESLKTSFAVDLMRDGEVMIVSLPLADLFLPNDTLMSSPDPRTLNQLLPLFKDPYMYKIILTMNTDDTGTPAYREFLSQARLNSVYDWFMTKINMGQINENLIIIPYSLDSSDPVASNVTRENRALNRRLEIYFVPGPKMIARAAAGKLSD